MYRYEPTDYNVEILGAADLIQSETGISPTRVCNKYRHQIPVDYTAFVADNAAGIRARFRTSAETIEIVFRAYLTTYVGQPPFPATIDLVDDNGIKTQSISGGEARIDYLSGEVLYHDGPVQTIKFEELSNLDRVVEIWLPHNASVEIIELVTSAPIKSIRSEDTVRWTHYGSSISHSALAPSPTRTWPAIAARALGWNNTNLGFAGNAMLDPYVARTIRDISSDLITMKVGINLINYDAMTMRTVLPAIHGFLDTVREGQPSTPIVLISPIACSAVENAPGPTGPDATMRLKAADITLHGEDSLTISKLRKGMKEIVSNRRTDDPHLHFLDGRYLFSSEDDAAGFSPDGLHPNDPGTELMANRFSEIAESLRSGTYQQ